jgi:uncharacterized protein (TIGR02145 family)
MKTSTLLFLLIIAIAGAQAQNYQISFAGTGASTTVDSVKVENLSQCTYAFLGGSDVLNLTATITGLNEINTIANNSLNIFPNPMTGNCSIDFTAVDQGKTTIDLYDITGKRILHVQELLSNGHQLFDLSGIGNGIYMLKVKSDSYSYTEKIVSSNSNLGVPELKHISAIPHIDKNKPTLNTGRTRSLKNDQSIISMQFNAGDTLKLTGKSGNYRTIVMFFPTQSQTLTFNFVDCTDKDGNHYAVVQIGTQLWMAENMKATKYRDGTSIPNLADSALWHNAITGAYCDYHNLPAEGTQFGHLYNWYAADTSLNIAPIGWHVSTDAEWTILVNFLGGASIAGRKIKENCNTRWAYLDTTWGTNTSGFTAVCTNFRNGKGASIDWSMAPNNDHDSFLWTSTNSTTTTAYVNALRWCYGDVWRCNCVSKAMGAVIRCVHD